MKEISFKQIFKALANIELPDCELVVGIAEGGVVPAALVARRIGCGLRVIRFNYRNEKNIPQHKQPMLIGKVNLPVNIKNILLVDDVAITGKTLNAAKELFKKQQVKTMVFRGRADYVLFPRITNCVTWPWKA